MKGLGCSFRHGESEIAELGNALRWEMASTGGVPLMLHPSSK